MSADLKQSGTGAAARPSGDAPARKPWTRPSYELASLDETEVGTSNGPDINTSVS